VLLDASLRRLDHVEEARPARIWNMPHALFGLLETYDNLAARRARVDRVYFGRLRLLPCCIAATDERGRAILIHAELRTSDQTFALRPSPLRFDRGGPLCDGDDVFVVARPRTLSDPGSAPLRGEARVELGGEPYVIGRGSPESFARLWSARPNARLLAFAFVYASVALTVLGFLWLRASL
jgi:hypothetical protein